MYALMAFIALVLYIIFYFMTVVFNALVLYIIFYFMVVSKTENTESTESTESTENTENTEKGSINRKKCKGDL